VICFNVVFQYIPGGTDENHENPPSVQLVSGPTVTRPPGYKTKGVNHSIAVTGRAVTRVGQVRHSPQAQYM
jgi:hypothetical protein